MTLFARALAYLLWRMGASVPDVASHMERLDEAAEREALRRMFP